jgi:hypothetical protein
LLSICCFLIFLILYTVCWTLRTGDQPVKRQLRTGQHKQNKRAQVSLPRVGFEITTPDFERAKTVHAWPRGRCDQRTCVDTKCKTVFTSITILYIICVKQLRIILTQIFVSISNRWRDFCYKWRGGPAVMLLAVGRPSSKSHAVGKLQPF